MASINKERRTVSKLATSAERIQICLAPPDPPLEAPNGLIRSDWAEHVFFLNRIFANVSPPPKTYEISYFFDFLFSLLFVPKNIKIAYDRNFSIFVLISLLFLSHLLICCNSVLFSPQVNGELGHISLPQKN